MLGLDVLPSLAIDDAVNNSVRDPEMFMKTPVGPLLRGLQASHLQHQVCYQLGFSLLFTAKMYVSPLFVSVLDVLKLCPKPKMVRIYTRWIVAFVKNAHAFWNGAAIQNPTSAVSADFNGSTPELAVSIRMPVRCPNPTSIAFLNLGPKSFGERLGKTLRSQILGSNLGLHSKFVLLCRALGCSSSAEASSL